MTAMPPFLRLGLIGDNIARSKSPLLHRLAGKQNDMIVEYDRLIPKEIGAEFEAVFEQCAGGDYQGINITYPYKERVISLVEIDDPFVRAIGAVNTVIFEKTAPNPKGYNTDHSGFISAYHHKRGDLSAGAVALIGTGGVGRAIAFALLKLGATEIRLFDRDIEKMHMIKRDLETTGSATTIVISTSAEAAAKGAAGIINCTPIGMVGYDGTPIKAEALLGATWAFDAVYTPVDTQFLQDAEAAGLDIISGYELFFYQGVHAWAHFSGKPLDEDALRIALQNEA